MYPSHHISSSLIQLNLKISSFEDLIKIIPKELRFKMKDKDVPNYNHGGGKIKNYSGETTIQPGAFKYKSPCPPDGTHTYEWTITAIGDKKKKLGKAVATRNYPE